MTGTNSLPTWIDSIGKAVGVIAAASLGASIIYDWGFLRALDLSFSVLPSSLSDHIRSSLVWVPVVSITAFVILIYELLTRRIEQGMTEEEIIERSPDPERTRKMRSRPYKFLTILGFIILLLYILFGEIFWRGLPIALMVIWFWFSSWANRHPRILERRQPSIRFLIHWIPPFIIWMAFIGYNDAQRLIQEETPKQMIYLNENPKKPVNTCVLRVLERGILVKVPENKSTVFFLWSSIEKIQFRYKKEPFKGIIFNWFNVGSVKHDGKIKFDPEPQEKKRQ